jgi:hypothetical protein
MSLDVAPIAATTAAALLPLLLLTLQKGRVQHAPDLPEGLGTSW